jgi:hypothetical protein
MFRPVPRPIPDFDRKIVSVPSHIPYRILTDCPGPSRPVPSRPVPSRPVPWQDFNVVLLSRDNEGTYVPLSRKVALSRPVGNASLVGFMESGDYQGSS